MGTRDGFPNPPAKGSSRLSRLSPTRSMPTTFLGLDVGTSSVKAALFDGRGRTVARASEPLAMRVPQPGWAEQNPVDWWKAAMRAIKRAVGKRKIDAVGLSGQMHSSVFLDSANKVIRPALLWCDGRTTAQCRAIAARVDEAS